MLWTNGSINLHKYKCHTEKGLNKCRILTQIKKNVTLTAYRKFTPQLPPNFEQLTPRLPLRKLLSEDQTFRNK